MGSHRFGIEITDNSRLQSTSDGRQVPVDILRVFLPLQLGAEIPLYKSKDLSIAILFESGSE